jgi:hypothetical protein
MLAAVTALHTAINVRKRPGAGVRSRRAGAVRWGAVVAADDVADDMRGGLLGVGSNN